MVSVSPVSMIVSDVSDVQYVLKLGGNATDATAVLFVHIWWIPQPRVWESDLYVFN